MYSTYKIHVLMLTNQIAKCGCMCHTVLIVYVMGTSEIMLFNIQWMMICIVTYNPWNVFLLNKFLIPSSVLHFKPPWNDITQTSIPTSSSVQMYISHNLQGSATVQYSVKLQKVALISTNLFLDWPPYSSYYKLNSLRTECQWLSET